MKFCLTSRERLGSYKLDYGWFSLLQSYKNYVTKTATVLEIGASVIEYTKELSKECGKLIGVELFPERKPDDFDNVQYKIGDWQNLSQFIQPASIDVLVSNHVLEHVPNDLMAINESYVVLKSGGVVLLSTPNRKRLPRAIIELFAGERKFPWWEHQREYTEKDLITLLKNSFFQKFEIIPVSLGIHGGVLFHFYLESVPKCLRKYANFWEIHLFKG